MLVFVLKSASTLLRTQQALRRTCSIADVLTTCACKVRVNFFPCKLIFVGTLDQQIFFYTKDFYAKIFRSTVYMFTHNILMCTFVSKKLFIQAEWLLYWHTVDNLLIFVL